MLKLFKDIYRFFNSLTGTGEGKSNIELLSFAEMEKQKKGYYYKLTNIIGDTRKMSQDKIQFTNPANQFYFYADVESLGKEDYSAHFSKCTEESKFHAELVKIIADIEKQYSKQVTQVDPMKAKRVYELKCLKDAVEKKSKFSLNIALTKHEKEYMSDSGIDNFKYSEKAIAKTDTKDSFYDDSFLYSLCHRISDNNELGFFGKLYSDNNLIYKLRDLLSGANKYIVNQNKSDPVNEGIQIYNNKDYIIGYYSKYGTDKPEPVKVKDDKFKLQLAELEKVKRVKLKALDQREKLLGEQRRLKEVLDTEHERLYLERSRIAQEQIERERKAIDSKGKYKRLLVEKNQEIKQLKIQVKRQTASETTPLNSRPPSDPNRSANDNYNNFSLFPKFSKKNKHHSSSEDEVLTRKRSNS